MQVLLAAIVLATVAADVPRGDETMAKNDPGTIRLGFANQGILAPNASSCWNSAAAAHILLQEWYS